MVSEDAARKKARVCVTQNNLHLEEVEEEFPPPRGTPVGRTTNVMPSDYEPIYTVVSANIF